MSTSIGRRVRDLRGFRSMKVFAEPLGVSTTAISNVENGHTELSMSLALKISEVYNVSLDFLVKGIDSNELTEPNVEYRKTDKIEIDKDELIELQRLALKNTIAEKDRQIAALKNS